ncbi:MAG TPA: phosphopantetheine-binding protein [Gemmatimonadaceae bacterium]|jgi:acyl carrier protein
MERTLARGMHQAGATRVTIDNVRLPSILTAIIRLSERLAPADAPVRICAFHQCIPMSDVNAQSVEDRIAGVVRRLLAEHSIDRAVGPDEDLRQAGLSSLDMVSLVLSVEEEFDLMVPEVSIMPSNFRSIAAIGRVVVSLRKPH